MSRFEKIFGTIPSVEAAAPGRVNLIGEHTDYNGGFVLPMPIPRTCRVQLRIRGDDRVRVSSANQGGDMREYRLGSEKPLGDWLDYIQGCTALLSRQGQSLTGFDAFIASDVPLGGGLSSSAALDVALLRALRAAFRLPLSDLDLARLGQRIENEFVGARVGIMDPLVASLGRPGFALFVDTRELTWRQIPIPEQAEFVILDSGVRHRHSAGDYNTRRSECEQACRDLGVSQLRELGREDLSRIESLPDPLRRRARHVVTENDRVLQAVSALEAGDLHRLGRLFDESHASQRDDYEVSVPEIETLIALAHDEPGVIGRRLTGGGFGGSIVLLTIAGRGQELGQRIAEAYSRRAKGVSLPARTQITPLVVGRSA
ncbi:MAG: galactokinase [Gemmatales bacterium]|nr:galactokinase [Gemmatales bacterium]MDW8386285.1 galactokinase [Gemmatales bacterium]